ncbi:MAG: phosphoribosyltransferase family protein [Synechococcaceae cyanobacterium]|nr:phosphoribosyltransferase family protein [Synechococcaceae cyanobacterium]
MTLVPENRGVLMERPHHLWRDRRTAGLALAGRLADLRGGDGVLVALPRGGVAVAAPMATALQLPLVTWAVRKLADPSYPEYALGAVGPGGVVLWDEADGGFRRLSEPERQALVADQEEELQRRRRLFGDPPGAALQGRPLVVVDDGIATGMTVRAALASLRRLGPRSLTLAVPVVDRRVLASLEAMVERLEALAVVERLRAVGEWYAHFEQLDDAAVLALLETSRSPAGLRDSPEPRSGS